MSHSRNVLVLEDDPDFFEILMMCLEEELGGQIHLIWVKNSSTAEEVVRSTSVDLIITDYEQSPGNAEPLLRCIGSREGLSKIGFAQVICMSSHAHPVGGFKNAVDSGSIFLSKCDSQFTGKIAAEVRKRLRVPASLEIAA